MRRTVEVSWPDLLELAADAVGADPFERIDEGTRYAQPAIFCAAMAGWRAIRDGLDPLAMGGHSLGEIAALVAAGSLPVRDGVRLIAERGRLMQEAAEAAGDGGMVAVLGEPRSAVEEVARTHDLILANDNSPTQVVLSGRSAALEAAEADLRERGLRAMPLAVSGAFHSPEMAPAAAGLRRVLDGIEFSEPAVPVFSCVTAKPFTHPREELARSLTDPVRWLEVMQGLQAMGATRFVETGPGKVLSRLARRTLDGIEASAPIEGEMANA
jgi:acyl transferase domain-containing protein